MDTPKLPSYRMNRWDVWKDKFEAIAGLEHLDEAYKGYAAGAAEEMRRLEGEASS